MSNRDAMMRYCKAQAELNALSKTRHEDEKTVSERIRTYRSLLYDELKKNRMTCCEVLPDGHTEPMYVRLKSGTQNPTLDAALFLTILRTIKSDQLAEKAERFGFDIPRILAAIVNEQVKQTYMRKTNQTTLSITSSKERGFNLGTNSTPIEVRRLANELFKARDELKILRNESKKLKQPHLEEQTLVEEEVKETLRTLDPVNKVQRVHMTQDGDEWVYFLRCKETTRPEALGIRKAIPLLEETLARTLESIGVDRNYSDRFRFTNDLWEELTKQLTHVMEERNVKETSRLTLERGAPRNNSVKQTQNDT